MQLQTLWTSILECVSERDCHLCMESNLWLYGNLCQLSKLTMSSSLYRICKLVWSISFCEKTGWALLSQLRIQFCWFLSVSIFSHLVFIYLTVSWYYFLARFYLELVGIIFLCVCIPIFCAKCRVPGLVHTTMVANAGKML